MVTLATTAMGAAYPRTKTTGSPQQGLAIAEGARHTWPVADLGTGHEHDANDHLARWNHRGPAAIPVHGRSGTQPERQRKRHFVHLRCHHLCDLPDRGDLRDQAAR